MDSKPDFVSCMCFWHWCHPRECVKSHGSFISRTLELWSHGRRHDSLENVCVVQNNDVDNDPVNVGNAWTNEELWKVFGDDAVKGRESHVGKI